MRILALDGNSIINRAFYGIRVLSTKDGVFTNAIYGFMNILLKLIENNNPDLIIAAFDLKAPTFRHKMYSEYKAGRKPMPEELRMQIPIMKDLLKAFGCAVLEKEGYEADDILGTIAKKCNDNGDTCVIATGDRDSLQLVSENVTVQLAATKAGAPEVRIYDVDKIKEEYGVTPTQMIEIKALQGDASDNIPGVAGVGPKTAGTLIQKFGTVENLYENIETADIRENLKNKLIADKDNAFLSKTLGTINCEVPIEIPNEAKRNDEELKSHLIHLEMFKLLDKLNLDSETDSKSNSVSQQISVDLKEIDKVPDNSIILFFDDKTFIKNDDRFFYTDNKDLTDVKSIITHDCKSLFHKIGGHCDVAFDTMLAAYLINPDRKDYSLDRFTVEYSVNEYGGEYSEILNKLELVEKLCNEFKAQIVDNNQEKLLYEIEIPLSYTLYMMENEGFMVDVDGINRFSEKLYEREKFLEQQIYDIIGYEFNLNSPKQLGVALFEKLGLPCSKKTKTGYSTNAEVLEGLKYESEAVEYLLEYRSVAKLKSTYCDGLIKCVENNNRIHSTLNQVETRTGRISSSEPNLQNIPVRTELGREMRKFFIAKDGYVLVDADYSQIELRVLASIADDKKMIDAFLNNVDIHSVTASEVFNVPLEYMTPEIRSRAKAVNFGIVYGIGAFSLSKDIHVSVAEAKRYIENYLATYSGVNKYMNDVVQRAKQDGYVSTYFGRRRYLPELTASNFNTRSFGERVAKNMPIQGTAADIIKIAMNRVNKRLIDENLDAKLIMQVHDELIIEAKEEIADKVSNLLKEEMENAVDFKVPLLVDVKYAKTWYETK
ncbi:MAG: DNA polymerase I [Acutalibacteraceae bacterium]|nr:DNA polymerase I [Acutalibacteraceae bacterium]